MQSAQEQLEVFNAYFDGKNSRPEDKNPHTGVAELAVAWQDGYHEARLLEMVGHCKTMLTAMDSLWRGVSATNRNKD